MGLRENSPAVVPKVWKNWSRTQYPMSQHNKIKEDRISQRTLAMKSGLSVYLIILILQILVRSR